MSIGDWSGIAAFITALGALLKVFYDSRIGRETLAASTQKTLEEQESSLRTFLTAEVMRLEERNRKLFDEVRLRGDLIIEIQKKHEEEIKLLRSCDKEKDERIAALEQQNKAQQAEIKDLRDENGKLRAALQANGIEVPPERRWSEKEA